VAPDGKVDNPKDHLNITLNDECLRLFPLYTKVYYGFDPNTVILKKHVRGDHYKVFKVKMRDGKELVGVPLLAVTNGRAPTNLEDLREWRPVSYTIINGTTIHFAIPDDMFEYRTNVRMIRRPNEH
jgi:hypothetical protein